MATQTRHKIPPNLKKRTDDVPTCSNCWHFDNNSAECQQYGRIYSYMNISQRLHKLCGCDDWKEIRYIEKENNHE